MNYHELKAIVSVAGGDLEFTRQLPNSMFDADFVLMATKGNGGRIATHAACKNDNINSVRIENEMLDNLSELLTIELIKTGLNSLDAFCWEKSKIELLQAQVMGYQIKCGESQNEITRLTTKKPNIFKRILRGIK